MRLFFKGMAGLSVLAATGLGAVMFWPIGHDVAPIALEGDIRRGAYLARASGCIACHTDWEGGGAPLAGGAPLVTDFGTFYPANLTTDPDHGIGAWSIEDFARAVRQGISPQGEPYYPAYTYPFYAKFSDQDIADLWAAFQTVSPVAEPSKTHDVSFPFDQRWGLKLWRAAFLLPPRTAPVAGRSDEWNRGRWLVEGAAHCAACHTGRNFAGGRTASLRFQGNPNLPGGSKAPAITAAALQSRGWDVGSLAYSLKTGLMADGDVYGGSMAEVVTYGTAFLSDDDLRSMAVYLLNQEEQQ